MAQKYTPMRHQNFAHDNLVLGLEQGDRAQLHMACGTGKTLVMANLAGHKIETCGYDDPVIIVSAPNRDLVRQNAEGFRDILGDSVDYIGICTEDQAAEATDTASHLRLTTNADDLRAFIGGSKRPKIIFSTLQSMKTTKEGLMVDGVQTPVELLEADEAHRLAGHKDADSLFAFSLYDDNIEVKKRAFFTATPRIVNPSPNKPVLSMAEPELFGPTVFEYSFREAVDDGVIVDYDLWTPVIDQQELARIASDRGIEDESQKRELLAEIALEKVMEQTGQSKVLTYHNRIKASQNFSERMAEKYEPLGFTVGHIDGSTPGPERKRLYDAMGGAKAILSNSNTIVEGTNLPGLQIVMYVDPRSSVIDVTQALGRAVRKEKTDPHKRASIIVPLVIDSADPRTVATQAGDQGFATLIQTLTALRSNDSGVEDQIMHSSQQAGRFGAFKEEVSPIANMKPLALGTKISEEDLAEISKQVTLASLLEIKDPFADRVGKLQSHIEQYGELPNSKTNAGLAQWSSQVRKSHREGRIEAKQAAMLDGVEGWSWIAPRDKAEEVADHISAFYTRSRRMPDRNSERPAEKILGVSVRRAEHHFLYHDYENVSNLAQTKSKHRVEKAALRSALGDRGLLLRGEEGELSTLHGSVQKRAAHVHGGPDYEFVPKTAYAHLFRSGHNAKVPRLGLYLSEADKETLDALGDNHQIAARIDRAGRHKSPYLDGKLVDWYVETIDRGEAVPGKAVNTKSVSFLINRLQDRKVAGEPAYTRANLTAGYNELDHRATSLAKGAPKVKVEHVMKLISGVQKLAAKGNLKEAQAVKLDNCPGFSWVEPERAKGLLAPAVKGIVARHGVSVLNSRAARRGDNGLANTLRNVDHILEMADSKKGLSDDIKALKGQGHYVTLAAFGTANRKQIAEAAKAAEINIEAEEKGVRR